MAGRRLGLGSGDERAHSAARPTSRATATNPSTRPWLNSRPSVSGATLADQQGYCLQEQDVVDQDVDITAKRSRLCVVEFLVGIPDHKVMILSMNVQFMQARRWYTIYNFQLRNP